MMSDEMGLQDYYYRAVNYYSSYKKNVGRGPTLTKGLKNLLVLKKVYLYSATIGRPRLRPTVRFILWSTLF